MLRKLVYCTSLLVVLAIGFHLRNSAEVPVAAAADIQITRAQFAQYIDDFSEPDGFFDTDNFISNETSYLHVIPELRRRVKPGFVYLGVGPDQNFSYIVHTQPALAIITDIRRQNMVEHLLYKTIFDLSASRAEFVAMLFSREVPKEQKSLSAMLAAMRSGKNEQRYRTNLAAIRNRLLQGYGLKLSNKDLEGLEYVYKTLSEEGVDLRFSSIGRNNAANYPTFEKLLLETDRSGQLQGYLATEESFQWMKRFEAENRLIPIVGDFAGPKALKAVGAFLKKNGLMVSTFYTSNVEYYLFENSEWRPFVNNIRTLPVSEDAVFIRAYFSNAGGVHPQNVPGHRSTTLLQSMQQFLRDESAGRIKTYFDIVAP